MSGEIELADQRTLTHLIGHDSAGLFGRMAVGAAATPRSFNRIAVIGDSTAEQIHLDSARRNRSAYNHFFVGNALAGNPLSLTGNFGVSGERTDQTLARLTAALATGAGTLYISEGINNFAQAPYTHAISGQSIAVAQAGSQAFADTLTKIDAALALGLRVIVALCHGASNFGSAQIGQMFVYNNALRRAAELRPNLWLLDTPSVLHDPAATSSALTFRTGYLRSGESTLAHESVLGAYFVAKEFAKILLDVMRPIPRNKAVRANQRSADNRVQLLLNPLFNATAGTSGVLGAGGALASGVSAVPFEWSFARNSGDTTTTFTVGVEANAKGYGNDLVIAYNVSVAGGGVRVFQDLTGANADYWLAGDVLQGFATTAVDAGATGLAAARPYVEINGTISGVNATITSTGAMSDTSHGVFPATEGFTLEDATEPITVPTYSSKGYLSFKALGITCAEAGVGTVRLSMPQLLVRSTLVA